MREIFVVILAKHSERVKDKNLQVIGGNKLIEIAINNAKQITQKDNIFISSSYSEYGIIAKRTGINYVCRPIELSTKETFISEVIQHFGRYLINDKNADLNDILINLDVSCPFTTAEQIKKVISLMDSYDSCFSCKQFKGTFIDDKPSISNDRLPRLVNFPAIRARTIKTAVTSTGWGRNRNHIDLCCIPEWHIDINRDSDLNNARTLWPIRKKLSQGV